MPNTPTSASGLAAAKAATLDDARPDAMAKRARDGKLSARQRVASLLDASSFMETGGLAGPHRDNPWNADLQAPADGVITGGGLVDGRPVAVVSHDFTVHGGSTGVAGSTKNNRTIQRATESGVPLVMLVEGGGHRIQDGQNSRHFAAGSRVFHLLGMNSGWTPMVVAVLGAGFAGPSNYASMADFVVMLRGGAQMGMAGPALVKAGVGEDIDKEALGGAKLQADRYGIADLAVETEAEVMESIRRFLSYLPSNSNEPLPLAEPIPPTADPASLLDLVPADQRQTYDVRKVVDVIVDEASRFEFKPTYARNVLTCFAPAERSAGRHLRQQSPPPGRYAGCQGL